jgi:hypothetical protein
LTGACPPAEDGRLFLAALISSLIENWDNPHCSRQTFIKLRKSSFSHQNMGNKEIILHFRRIHMISYDIFIDFF